MRVCDVPPPTVRVKIPLLACIPVPVSGMVVGEFGSELEIESVAVLVPTAEGLNVTMAVQPWLGASVLVEHGDVTAKLAALGPLMVEAMLVTGAVPVLRRLSVRMAGELTLMLP